MGKSTISRSEAGELEILPLLQSFKLDPTAATTSQQNLPHVKEADLDIKELKTIVEEISTRPPLDKRIFGNSQIQHQFPDVFNRNSNCKLEKPNRRCRRRCFLLQHKTHGRSGVPGLANIQTTWNSFDHATKVR